MNNDLYPESNMTLLANGIDLTITTIKSLVSDEKVRNYFGSNVANNAVASAFISAVRNKVYHDIKQPVA